MCLEINLVIRSHTSRPAADQAMPELPEVETVRRGLAPAMEGARFAKVEVHRGDLRWPLPKDFAQRLEGKTVTGLGRRAKYLLADLSSGDVLLMHLGMSGSFHVFQEKRQDSSAAIITSARNTGARPCRVSHVVRRDRDLQRSAPLRLDEARGARQARRRAAAARARPRAARQRVRRRHAGACVPGKKTSLKAALLDQRVVAGLGNIYVCEALYRARLSPKRQASTIAGRNGEPNERAERLVEAIKAVLNDAIKAGGSSLRDHRQTDGELGISSTISGSTTARASRAGHRAAAAPSSASCRTAARRFIVRRARSDRQTCCQGGRRR